MRVTILLLFILLSCTIAPVKQEPRQGDYTNAISALQKFIHDEMKKNNIHGLSIALINDQKIIFSGGFGLADRERKIAATDETIYGIGSVTKIFTATAVMQLVERGKIDINQPLERYVPEFSMKSRYASNPPITVKNLLTHHSGLPGDYLKGMWSLHPEPFNNLISKLKKEYVSYPPDYVYAYSSLAFGLLGEVIQKTERKDYESYVNESIFKPAGMSHTSFKPLPEFSSLQSAGYRKGKPGAEKYYIREVPGGGAFSTARDMSRFIKELFNETPSIIKTETLARMFQPQNTNIELDMDASMGIGWMLGKSELNFAGRVAHHSGGTLGSASELMILPERKLGVIVLANAPESSPVLSLIAVRALRSMLEIKYGKTNPVNSQPSVAPSVNIFPEKLASFAGNYAGNIYSVFNVIQKGNRLQTEFQNKTFSLLPIANDKFKIQFRLFGFIPLNIPAVSLSMYAIKDHKVIALENSGRRYPVAVRIDPKPVPKIWRNRTGKYIIVNKGEDGTLIENIEISCKNGLLVLNYTLPEAPGFIFGIALNPLNNTEAVSYGLGRFLGETFRVTRTGNEERLLYSGYELKKKK